jgi:hypothetical protein
MPPMPAMPASGRPSEPSKRLVAGSVAAVVAGRLKDELKLICELYIVIIYIYISIYVCV